MVVRVKCLNVSKTDRHDITEILLKVVLNTIDRTMISYKNKLIFVGAAYICTEDIFPNKRLHQMIQYFCRKMEDRLVKNYGDGIFIEHISDLVSMRKHFSRTYI